MKKCPKCGAELKEGLLFCPKCGEIVKDLDESTENDLIGKKEEKKLKVWQIILLVLFWPFGITYLIAKKSKWDKKKKTIILAVFWIIFLIYSFTSNKNTETNEITMTTVPAQTESEEVESTVQETGTETEEFTTEDATEEVQKETEEVQKETEEVQDETEEVQEKTGEVQDENEEESSSMEGETGAATDTNSAAVPVTAAIAGSTAAVAAATDQAALDANEENNNFETGETPSTGNFVGNRNNHKLHRATCSSLPKAENQVIFDTKEEAIAAGYNDPCKRCNP